MVNGSEARGLNLGQVISLEKKGPIPMAGVGPYIANIR